MITCPNCKNPLSENSRECDWCGNEVQTKTTANISCYINFSLKRGASYRIDEVLLLFINNKLVKSFNVKDGIDFQLKINDDKVKIEYEWEGFIRRYHIANLIVKNEESYKIEWSIGILGNVQFKSPKIYVIK